MQKVVTFGEIMVRLSAPDYLMLVQADKYGVSFAGSEANVAVSLANYGISTDYVTILPDNPIAERCVRELRGLKVGVDNIVRDGDRIGVMYQETGSNGRPSRVYYDRAGSAFANLKKKQFDWENILTGASWLHWSGITPALAEYLPQECEKVLMCAREKGLVVSCDINYRKNLWRYGKKAKDVMPRLLSMCDVIIGNEADCEDVLGISPSGFDVDHTGGNIDQGMFVSVCRQVMERFPKCRMVALTLRGSINANHNTWGGVLYDGQQLYQSPRFEITDIVDRVGAGDSFSAGLIYGLMHYGVGKDALGFAVASSCLKHTIKGDYNQVSVDDVERMMEGNTSGRVIR